MAARSLLASASLPACTKKAAFRKGHTGAKGFALVTVLAIIPLLISLITTVGAGLYILKRRSLAQAICVQRATLLQRELKETLESLIRLNPKAQSLRRQRHIADQALKTALLSGQPPLIAAAKAARMAVILQQTALRAQQTQLLFQANLARKRARRELDFQSHKLRRLGPLKSLTFFPLALAVKAKPLATLTPDYVPARTFEWLQQHRFRFRYPLLPPLPNQTAECSVTLARKENTWTIQILAANAASRSLLF